MLIMLMFRKGGVLKLTARGLDRQKELYKILASRWARTNEQLRAITSAQRRTLQLERIKNSKGYALIVFYWDLYHTSNMNSSLNVISSTSSEFPQNHYQFNACLAVQSNR